MTLWMSIDGFGLEVASPLTPWRELRTRREGRAVDRAGERSAQDIVEKRGWIGQDLENLLSQARAFVSGGDVAADELMGEMHRLSLGHAEVDQVFAVHIRWLDCKSGFRDRKRCLFSEIGEPAGMCALLDRVKAGSFAV